MKTEEEIIEKIEEEIPYIGIKPISHNIIGIELLLYSQLKGEKATYELIKELGLDELGWYVPEEV